MTEHSKAARLKFLRRAALRLWWPAVDYKYLRASYDMKSALSLEPGRCEVAYQDRARAACNAWMEAIGEMPTPDIFDNVLQPRAEGLQRVLQSLEPYRQRNSPSHLYTVFLDDLYELYAFSRLHEMSLRKTVEHAPGSSDASPQQRLFWLALGFEALAPRPFSPLFHEIVQVTRDDSLSWPLVEHEMWPCLRRGEMVFARAGVHIRAPHRLIQQEIAERSRLYWAWWRQRPHEDLSHGWGSNSQWGTTFRRDYCEGDSASERWFFNVDAGSIQDGCPLHLVESHEVEALQYFAEVGQLQSDNLPLELRAEILWHRCCVRSLQPDDPWIWDDGCAMPAGQQCI